MTDVCDWIRFKYDWSKVLRAWNSPIQILLSNWLFSIKSILRIFYLKYIKSNLILECSISWLAIQQSYVQKNLLSNISASWYQTSDRLEWKLQCSFDLARYEECLLYTLSLDKKSLYKNTAQTHSHQIWNLEGFLFFIGKKMV